MVLVVLVNLASMIMDLQLVNNVTPNVKDVLELPIIVLNVTVFLLEKPMICVNVKMVIMKILNQIVPPAILNV